MATESPIRLMETSEKWPSHKDAASFGQSSSNITVEDMGLSFNRNFKGDGRNLVPNRCESAPPSMEGSVSAIQNLMTQQNSSLLAGFARPRNSIDGYDIENEPRASSAYFTYESSSVGVNARISAPMNAWKSDLVHRFGALGSDWKVKSHDDFGKRSLHPNLPTHKEEPEDDGSPGGTVADEGQQKSSVALVQDDMTIIQSPATNPPRVLSYGSLEGGVAHDANVREVSLSSTSTASVSGSSFANSASGTFVRPLLSGRQLPTNDVGIGHNLSSSNVTDSEAILVDSAIKAADVYMTQNSESINLKDQQQGSQNILPQQQGWQHGTTVQFQGSPADMTTRGTNYAYGGMPRVFHGPSTFSATEGQPILQSSGYTPPLYATTPFYPNMQLPGYYHPQFGAGGYAMNPAVHLPYLGGYSPYGALPQAFQGAMLPISGVSSGGNNSSVVDPLLSRFYGQLGLTVQPSFEDPLHMQYLQQSFRDTSSYSGHLDQSTPRDVAGGSPIGALDLRKGPEVATLMADQKIQLPGNAGHSVLNHSRRSVPSHYYLGNPSNVAPLMQFPSSPVASPVLSGTSAVGTSLGEGGGGRNDMKFPSMTSRNTGVYASWQGQGFDNSNLCSLLEELKSGKGRRFELSDITGHIVEFSTDQHGSRFIQQKLETCSPEEKASVFKEILPHAPKLMIDVFGNYVIQKFFEYGTTEQRKELSDQLEGQVLPLSLQMYGCRVIQKALEVIQLEQKVRLVQELDGQIMRCVRDQNGNHVIQKCIESIPTDRIGFILSSFHGEVAKLSTHPYGCRVIQRVLEHCTDQVQSQFIVDEILESVCDLAQDQYGNYVTQHILERGKPNERSQIISKLSGRVVQLSQHKFASNVIEKCLEYGDSASKDLLIEEILGHTDGNDNLLVMMKDQYANYVVQKILNTCSDTQREMLLSRVKDHVNALKKYTYGKHIVARFEQLYGEAN